MKTLTIRDFRTRPRQAQKDLAESGEAILTSSGRPVALMLRVDGESLDETVAMMRRARGLQALDAARREARRTGLDRVTMKEMDAVIARTRRGRRRRHRG